MKMFSFITSLLFSFNLLLAFGNTEEYEYIYGNKLSNSCINKEDGEYWFQLSIDNDNADLYKPVKLQCSNGYVILDVNKDSNLINYFSSYEMWHHSLAGPSNSNPVNWDEWFIPNEISNENKYIISPDCNTCELDHIRQVHNDHSTYWMTGNLAKLHWPIIGFNECDMDYDTYQCYDCDSCLVINDGCEPEAYGENTTDYSTSGICGVTVQESDHIVYKNRELAQSAEGIKNYKPSIGTGGQFCVCYQPANEVEYYLDDTQEDIIEAAMSLDEATEAHIIDENNNEDNNDDASDLRNTNIVYLTQSDFNSGTYRITESGTYIISEDIIFDFNPNDDYWPRSDQHEEYNGAASYRDEYHLGFFAGIAIECDYVTIDLNHNELKMSIEFYFQQRWFSIIELGNQQFLPGQGPAFFGYNPKVISNIGIKNGVLGRSSHFGIHGNFPTNLLVENVHIKDFVTHGLQLNGWNDLRMDNIEIGPSSTIEYLRGDYGHGRIILQRLRNMESYMSDELDIDIDNDDTYKVQFNNHQSLHSITDIANELEYQMNLAFHYAINRVDNRFSNSDYIDPNYLSTQEDKQRWEKAKKQFIHESGLPSASSITGLFLNFEGASVFSYTMYTTHTSNNGVLNDIYIHDIYHDMVESMRIAYKDRGGQMYPTPWNSDIPAEHAFGGKNKLYDFYKVMQSNDSLIYDRELPQFSYDGSIMTDAYFTMGTIGGILDDWNNLGFLEIRSLNENITDVFDWVNGDPIDSQDTWVFGCNQDIMGHSGKGLLGIRIDGVNNLEMNGIRVENLYEHSYLGSDACGDYLRFTPEKSGGHFKQSLPMQHGFSGNDLQGISIISSTNVNLGNILIDNLQNDYSQSYGLSLWTANDVNFREDSLVRVKNVHAGVKLEKDVLSWWSRPNRSPESCGVRLEALTNVDYYKSYVNFENEDDYGAFGKQNIITCNIEGHEMCLGPNGIDASSYYGSDDNDDDDDNLHAYTIYGHYFDEEDVCDYITDHKELQAFLVQYMGSEANSVDSVKSNVKNNKDSKVIDGATVESNKNIIDLIKEVKIKGNFLKDSKKGSNKSGGKDNEEMVFIYLLIASVVFTIVFISLYIYSLVKNGDKNNNMMLGGHNGFEFSSLASNLITADIIAQQTSMNSKITSNSRINSVNNNGGTNYGSFVF